MTEEDPNLTAGMQSLEIQAVQFLPPVVCDTELPLSMNPFARRRSNSLSNFSSRRGGKLCACKKKREKLPLRNTVSFKRPSGQKLLRDPILKLSKCSRVDSKDITHILDLSIVDLKTSKRPAAKDFKSIVDGCEHLNLASGEDVVSFPDSFRERSASVPTRKQASNSSCSQQAMARMSVNPPCDVTIDELASYFETFVHIPKKMSSMAEMMYI